MGLSAILGPARRTQSDTLEQRLLREALDADVPVFAICRGMQLLNVCHEGGTLIQHVENHEVRGPDPSLPVHDVTVMDGTKLAAILGSEFEPVNSRHHQAVGNVGRNLIVSARAPEGVVEALERPDRRFVIAVQWHPEDQVGRLLPQRRLFEAFAEAL